MVPTIIDASFFSNAYHQHRKEALQPPLNITTQSKFEVTSKAINNNNLKNLYSLLNFTHTMASLSTQELSNFTVLLEKKYLEKKTIHHFTDLAIARIFLENKYPHLHIRTNKFGLSNVFTDERRIQDFIFCLNILLNKNPGKYAESVEYLYQLQEKTDNRHAQLNFAIALSLADSDLRKKFEKKRKTDFFINKNR